MFVDDDSDFARKQAVSVLAFLLTLIVVKEIIDSAINMVSVPAYLFLYIRSIYNEYFACILKWDVPSVANMRVCVWHVACNKHDVVTY